MNIHAQTKRGLCHGFLALMLTFVGGLTSPAWSKPVDLSRAPPDLSTTVPANIALTFDDSGSMSFGYMPDNADDYCGWKYASSDYNTIYYNPQITYDPPLDKNGDAFPDIDFNAAPLDGYHTILGFGDETIDLSKEYIPTLEWDRDADEDNNTISDSCVPDSVQAVETLKDGVTLAGGVYSYTCGLFDGEYAHVDDYYDDEMCEVPPELDLHCDSNQINPCVVHPPASYDYIWDREDHAYYAESDGTIIDLTIITTGAAVDGTTRSVAQEQQNFANWFSYYRTRNLMTKTAVTQTFANLDVPIQLVWQTIWPGSADRPWSKGIATSDSIDPYQDILDADGAVVTVGNKSDFFDWLLNVRSSNGTPDRAATQRAGDYFVLPDESPRTGGATDPYWNRMSGDEETLELACRQNYHLLVTDGYWNEGDSQVATPTKTTDGTTMGTTKDGRAAHIAESSIYWNVEGDDAYAKSLANIAYHYWATDLAPGIDDHVVQVLDDPSHDLFPAGAYDADDPWANDEIYFNPKNDPATWQHLVQFVVTLGMDGELDHPADYVGLRKGDVAWPYPVADQPSALDDMWHAAINSRGEYFSASNPASLVEGLSSILNSVAARSSSAVAASVNTGVFTDNSVSYSGTYDSATWSGALRAYELNLVSVVDPDTGHAVRIKKERGAEIWNAACLLDGGGCTSGSDTVDNARSPSSRTIFTSSAVGAGHGVPFLWGSIGTSLQGALNRVAPDDLIGDRLGDERLAWLRGDRSNEGTLLRKRASVMGAVVRSQAAYVSHPDSEYRNFFPETSPGVEAPEVAVPYEDFVTDHKERTPVLYVGANDGMLHAFEAATGKELFAYVPQSVYWRAPGVPGLSTLSNVSTYEYMPTVDNTPVQRDVFFGGAWHSLLVGTLGMGGRGVFALDISDPDSFAASDVLWEFNSTSIGGENMGYTYGQAEIARLASGKWAVLVPGGYFPKDPDDPNHTAAAASNTFSSLFVLDAKTGALIRELTTAASETATDLETGHISYGLSTPVLGDYGRDQVDDVAFAGDLAGNLWRFDLTDPDEDNWTIDLVYQGKNDADGEPEQPITVKPRLFPDPVTGKFIVLFGTGKYLGEEDRLTTGVPVQAIYGIREQGASTETGFEAGYYPIDFTDGELVEQDMKEDADTTIRSVTQRDVPGGKAGWYINLDDRDGERVVVRAGAIFSTNQAIISTLIPTSNDPCNPGRIGADILLDAPTGGAVGIPAFRALVPDYGEGDNLHVATGIVDPVGDGNGGGGGDDQPSIGDSGSAQPVMVEPGGCRGIAASGINIPMPCWRRRSWQVLDVLD